MPLGLENFVGILLICYRKASCGTHVQKPVAKKHYRVVTPLLLGGDLEENEAA